MKRRSFALFPCARCRAKMIADLVLGERYYTIILTSNRVSKCPAHPRSAIGHRVYADQRFEEHVAAWNADQVPYIVRYVSRYAQRPSRVK